ncbi:MAG: hypothetical protein KAT37_01910 [Candidatus Aenigmarchaeota archaeon]|nr:hypothetical protein [Candidatus Aenigmarchaeota archaeon]
MEKTNLISFEKTDIKNIFKDLNIKTKEENGRNFIIDSETGGIEKCHICEKKLTTKNIGNIAKGSKLLFCDNPICFVTHLENIRI